MHKADTILKTLLNLQAGYPMAAEVYYKPRKNIETVIPIWLGQEQLWKINFEGKGLQGYRDFYQEGLHKVLHTYCHLDILKHIPR